MNKMYKEPDKKDIYEITITTASIVPLCHCEPQVVI